MAHSSSSDHLTLAELERVSSRIDYTRSEAKADYYKL